MKSALRIGMIVSIALTIGIEGMLGATLPLWKGVLTTAATKSIPVPPTINPAVPAFLAPAFSPSFPSLVLQDNPEFVDAISREFTLYNDPSGGTYESIDATSREFTLYNDPSGGTYESIDAISREFTLYNDPSGGTYESIDAISREFTLYNDPSGGTYESIDAISREFTLYNDPSGGTYESIDAISREFTLLNDPSAVLLVDAISREFTVLNGVDTESPETVITTGPAENSLVCALPVQFTFTGSDRDTPTDRLVYQWRINNDDWSQPSSQTTATFNTLSDGQHRFEVRAIDESQNVDPSPAARNFRLDTTAPLITNPRAENVTSVSALIRWETNEGSTSKVEYRRTTETNWQNSAESTVLVTNHQVSLLNLSSNANYVARVVSRDACGHSATSAEFNFTTSLQPDLRVSEFNAPAAATAGDTINLSWVIRNDGRGRAAQAWLDRVYLSTDDQLNQNEDVLLMERAHSTGLNGESSLSRSGTATIPQNTAQGSYYLIIMTDATNSVPEADETNNTRSRTLAVTLFNAPPNVVITSGPDGENPACSMPVTFTWTGEDDATSSVDLEYSHQLNGSEWSVWSRNVSVVFDSLTDGEHLFRVRVRDSQGLVDPTPAERIFTVALNAPQISQIREAVEQSAATISWLTSTRAASRVEYGTSPNYGNSESNEMLKHNHALRITGLQSNTLYHYRIVSTDACGNEASSEDRTFRTGIAPDLTVQLLQAPAEVSTGNRAFIEWRVRNEGQGNAGNRWYDCIYLSTDSQWDESDVRLGCLERLRLLTPGSNYELAAEVVIPQVAAGSYRFIIVTDFDNRQTESREDNNIAVSNPVQIVGTVPPVIVDIPNDNAPERTLYLGTTPQLSQGTPPITWSLESGPEGMTINPTTGVVRWEQTLGSPQAYNITIKATNVVGSDAESWQLTVPMTYSATVQTDVTIAPAGTPIPLTGQARLIGNNQPAPNMPVKIRLRVRGTERILNATSNANGNFSVLFTPLATEAGQYSIGASHPNDPNFTAQDSFQIVGMGFNPNSDSLTVLPGVDTYGQVMLRNYGDLPITGITATVENRPASLQVQVQAPSSLAGLAEVPLSYTLRSTGNQELSGTITIRLNSAQGARADLPVSVNIRPPRPILMPQPGHLRADMLRGSASYYQFDVVNTGGASTAPLQVRIPQEPWLRMVTPAELPAIAPGERVSIVLELRPAFNLPLGDYNGTVVVGHGQNYGIVVPYTFKAVSNQLSDVLVSVVNEFTFWSTGEYRASGGPLLEGARVQLLNPESGEMIHEGITTSDEQPLRLSGVQEGYYTLQVSAPEHASYRQLVRVDIAQGEVFFRPFVPRQAIQYEWTVRPTEIEDRYLISLITRFETFVPQPVVTVDPPLVDLSTLTSDITQIDFRVKNHGLIRAEQVSLRIPSHPGWRITVLSEELGDLAALEERVVPVLIERIGGAALDGGPCELVGEVRWSLICIGRVGYRVPIHFTNAKPGCRGIPWDFGRWRGCDDCRTGPVDPITYPPVYNSPSPQCEECDPDDPPQDLFCLDPTVFFGGITSLVRSQAKRFLRNSFIVEILDIVPEACVTACCNPDGTLSFGSSVNLSGLVNILDLNPLDWNFRLPFRFIMPIAEQGDVTVEMDPIGYLRPFITADSGVRGRLTFGCGNETNFELSLLSNYTANGFSVEANKPFLVYSHDGAFGGEIVIGAGIANLSVNIHSQGDFISRYLNGVLNTQGFFDGVYLTIQFEGIAVMNSGEVIEVNHAPMTRFYLLCPTGTVRELPEGWDANYNYLFDPNCDPDGWDDSGSGGGAGDIPHIPNTDQLIRSALSQLVNRDFYTYEMKPKSDFGTAGGPQEGVCASVILRLDQQVTLARQAFEAKLDVTNPSDEVVKNLLVGIEIRDQDGNSANDKFAIYPPGLEGITGVDGTGILAPHSRGSATWTIVPRASAAPFETKTYYVGGVFRYRHGGTDVVAPLLSARIEVQPDPRLYLNYFWQRDVYSDDPFTPEIEPAEPFSLGLVMSNRGYGAARNVRITTSQPEIIENERGLLIDFEIIGTQVGSQPVTPSLNVALGDILPQRSAVARWLMRSSLQGTFTDYFAFFEHLNPLGDRNLSLIEEVNAYELDHVVRVVEPSDDQIPDFLANIDRSDTLPDKVYLSDGSNAPVAPRTDAQVDRMVDDAHLQVQLTLSNPPNGYLYIRVDDPGRGQYRLQRVVRSDGREILMDYNAWTTHRTKRPLGQPAYRENRLHLFDSNSTGQYTLIYGYMPPATSRTSEAKELQDGRQTTLGTGDGVIVTAVFPDGVYVSMPDRSAGIKVTNTSLTEGARVSITGIMRTDNNGERYVEASTVQNLGQGRIRPLTAVGRSLFCGDYRYNPAQGTGQRGVTNGVGLNLIGLLVSTIGTVTVSEGNLFILDDGSANGITIQIPAGTVRPQVGARLKVTGILTLKRQGSTYSPLIRVRRQDDMTVMNVSRVESPGARFRRGQNLFGIPSIPVNPDPLEVLAGIGNAEALHNRLSRFDATLQMTLFWDTFDEAARERFGRIVLGDGYSVLIESSQPGQLQFDGILLEPGTDVLISLPISGAALIANPFPQLIDWRSVNVSDGDRVVSIEFASKQAAPAWLGSVALYFDPLNQTEQRLGLPIDNPHTTVMAPWLGYWAQSYRHQLALIISSYKTDINGDGCVDDADLLRVIFALGLTGANIPEDVNEDGSVDDADLLAVLLTTGTGCLNIPGDVNGDGCVDDADLLVVLFNFGGTGEGDANGDGTVDDADLLVVLFNFGSGC